MSKGGSPIQKKFLSTSHTTGDNPKVLRSVILLLLVSLLFGLIFFAYQGAFSRMMADDFCYASKGRDLGILQGLLDIYTSWSGRYSTILLILATEPLTPWLVRILPAFLLLSWLASLIYLIGQLQKGIDETMPRWIGWTVAAQILYLVILVAPNRFQVLYWLNGSITYTLPLILLTILAGWSLSIIQREKSLNLMTGFGFGLLILLAAGFSETNAALQTGAFALAIPACLFFLKGDKKTKGIVLFTIGLGVSLLGISALALSPGNHIRQALFPQPPGFFTLVYLSLRYALAFIYHTFLGFPVPILFGAMISFVLGMSYQNMREKRGENSSRLKGVAWKIVIAFLFAIFGLIVCCTAPSAYAQSAYPEPRALLSATFIFIMGLAGLGFWLGTRLSGWVVTLPNMTIKRTQNFLLIVLLAGCLYSFYAGRNLTEDLKQAQAFSEKWDTRDQTIRQAIASGQPDLILPGLDSQHGISDLQIEPGFWVNSCMADYYQVKTITGK